MFASFKELFSKRFAFSLTVIVLIILALGVLIGLTLPYNSPLVIFSNNCLSNLSFINPEPGCETFQDKLDRTQLLQNDLETKVDGYLESKRAIRISVFARDLTSQRYAEVNGNDSFVMASLLKVPLAIAYYRLAEITPDLMTQQITYTGTPDLYSSQDVGAPTDVLVAGNSYSVQDLLFRALAYSDDTAAQLLSQNYVSDDYLQKILTAVGLPSPTNAQGENPTTVTAYAGLFRTLYNSSFLTRPSSNDILKMLSQSTFTEGAVAGIPKGVIVAHKFGERTVLDGSGNVSSRQLHDCGIVYANKGKAPYVFCIMTEGQDFPTLEAIIKDLSGTIYQRLVQ